MRSSVVAVALWVGVVVAQPAPVAAQAADTTSSREHEALFQKRDALFAGAFAAGTVALWPLDVAIAETVQDSVFQQNPWVRDAAGVFRWLGFPGSLGVSSSVYVLGRVLDRPRLADLGLHTTGSIALAVAVVFPMKSVAGRARPFMGVRNARDFELMRGLANDTFQAFPSGHTTAAFATAAAVTTELAEWWPERKPLIGGVLFTGATLVGVSRLYHNKHWATDAVVGAAVGSFSGWKLVRYTHSHPGNLLDRWLLPASAVPDGRGGVRLVWVLAR